MNYSRVQLGPIYRTIGVPVVLTVSGTNYPLPGNPPLRFLDKTAGDTMNGAIEIDSVHPAAAARVADIIALGLSVENLDDALLSMNSSNWIIRSHKLMPSPRGENDGEVYFFLEAA